MNNTTSHRATHAEPRAAAFEGWFDSSLDLKLGLVVTEHGALDALADEHAMPHAWRPESLTRWIHPGEQAHR